jgi:hypothetical protein
MTDRETLRYLAWVVIGGVLALALGIAVWWQPLFLGRMLERPDSVTHLLWSHQFFVALQENILYPRWAFASHHGLGDPTFLYYQPLFYYVTAFVSWLGFTPDRALVIAACSPFVMLGWIGYTQTAGGGPPWRSVAGAALLATCPAVYFLIMDGGAFPWGMAIPFCVLFVLESVKDRPGIAKVAILISLICLTHLLSGLIVLMCVGLGRLVFAIPGRHTLPAHLRWAAGVVVGIALAGFYILPAVSQQHLINPTAWTTTPTLNWQRGFAFPAFTWWRNGLQWFSFQWALPLLALTFSIIVILMVRRAPRERQPSCTEVRAWRLAVVALAALVLSSEFAYPLFALVPPLQKLQWAYRFVPLALALAILAFSTVAFRAPITGPTRWLRFACVGLVAAHCLLAAALQYRVYISGESLRTTDAAMRGDFGQPEYLVAGRGPDWERYVKDGQLAGECSRLGAECTNVTKRTHGMSLSVIAAAPLTIRMPLFAFPAWQVRVDGNVQPLEFDRATGLVSVPLSAGKHEISVEWIGLPVQASGNLLSWAALAMLGLILIVEARATPRTINAAVSVCTGA